MKGRTIYRSNGRKRQERKERTRVDRRGHKEEANYFPGRKVGNEETSKEGKMRNQMQKQSE